MNSPVNTEVKYYSKITQARILHTSPIYLFGGKDSFSGYIALSTVTAFELHGHTCGQSKQINKSSIEIILEQWHDLSEEVLLS
jgi:hypothetical protein